MTPSKPQKLTVRIAKDLYVRVVEAVAAIQKTNSKFSINDFMLSACEEKLDPPKVHVSEIGTWTEQDTTAVRRIGQPPPDPKVSSTEFLSLPPDDPVIGSLLEAGGVPKPTSGSRRQAKNLDKPKSRSEIMAEMRAGKTRT